MRINSLKFLILFTLTVIVFACSEEPILPPVEEDDDLTDIIYDPVPSEIVYPVYTQQVGFIVPVVPEMVIPEDNPQTEEGIELGRHLFYDTILSADSTLSCSSCHLPAGSFTDNKAVSFGIDGIPGKVSSMSLLNVGFYDNGLFWDGRTATLEEQALLPVEDEIELHNTWPNVISKLKKHDIYPTMFRKAFGIEKKSEITKELAAKAIAQFERSIYSFESKFDKFMKGEVLFNDEELNGFEMFLDLPGASNDAHCSHCHAMPLMTSNDYFNNGLQEAETLQDFESKGRGLITGSSQNGFFRAPSLRNIELTAPYMHDGSMQTLDEVMDHYISGGKFSPNRDSFIPAINLDDYEKESIIAFMKTLTDTEVINNEKLQNPFK
jgi:cytochrome c peroxidase